MGGAPRARRVDHGREARCGPAPRLPSAVHARSRPSHSTWDDESRVGGRENGPTTRESAPYAWNDLLRAERPPTRETTSYARNGPRAHPAPHIVTQQLSSLTNLVGAV